MIFSVFDPETRVYHYFRSEDAPIIRRKNAYASMPLIEDIAVELPPIDQVSFLGAGFLPRGVIAEKPEGWGEEKQTDHQKEAGEGASFVGWMAFAFGLGAIAGKAFKDV